MPPGETQAVLTGRGILVTRPVHQADRLCRLIEALGGRAVRFPVLEIRAPGDPAAVKDGLLRLPDYDLAIFVSANAVEFTLAALAPWPPKLEIAAVGAATAAALRRHGLPVAYCPAQAFTSEALLALPRLQQLAGKQILILRGEGGREQLRETLRARGARVDYLEVYQRVQPATDPTPLLQQWRSGEVGAVLVTSNESLRKLVAMIGTLGLPLLRATPLIVASTRTLELARELGLDGTVRVAADATDAAMTDALYAYFSIERGNGGRG